MTSMMAEAALHEEALNEAAVHAYLDILHRQIETAEGQYLFNFDQVDLSENDAKVVPLWTDVPGQGQLVTGGFHVVIDGDRTAQIQGVVVDPRYRDGRRMRMLLAARMNVLCRLGDVDGFALAVRVLPDGSINVRGHRLFSSLGFADDQIKRIPISGTRLDRHFLATVEPDGRSVRCLLMRRSADAVQMTQPVCLEG